MEKLGAILPEGVMSPEFSGAFLEKCEKKKEQKNPPLLYNLAELQNDCSRMFKISPDETLKIAQELYEKKEALEEEILKLYGRWEDLAAQLEEARG